MNKQNNSIYKYTYFLEDINQLDWVNNDLFKIQQWIINNKNGICPYYYNPSDYKYTKFLENIQQIDWINKDSFNFKIWLINNKLNYSPFLNRPNKIIFQNLEWTFNTTDYNGLV